MLSLLNNILKYFLEEIVETKYNKQKIYSFVDWRVWGWWFRTISGGGG